MEHWLCPILDGEWSAAFLWHLSSRDLIWHKEKDKEFWTQNGVSKFTMTFDRKTAYYWPLEMNELARVLWLPIQWGILIYGLCKSLIEKREQIASEKTRPLSKPGNLAYESYKANNQ